MIFGKALVKSLNCEERSTDNAEKRVRMGKESGKYRMRNREESVSLLMG
jgi:hypothetical protein